MCVWGVCVCMCAERGRERGERGSCVCQTTLNKTISGLFLLHIQTRKELFGKHFANSNPFTTSLSHASAQDFPATCQAPSRPLFPPTL